MHNHNTKNRIREHLPEGAAAMTDRCCEAVDEVVQQNPMAVTLAVFGVGVVVGTALVAFLGRSRRPAPQAVAESFGRKVLDSIADMLPDAVRQHLPV